MLLYFFAIILTTSSILQTSDARGVGLSTEEKEVLSHVRDIGLWGKRDVDDNLILSKRQASGQDSAYGLWGKRNAVEEEELLKREGHEYFDKLYPEYTLLSEVEKRIYDMSNYNKKRFEDNARTTRQAADNGLWGKRTYSFPTKDHGLWGKK